ncbi:4-(cytidine 5'-diphospho)-2-C-methyl-D-erythritol kinase [Dyella sp.]|uniref:4-(cytidine 5'-diphospho)-2-C-methyl-D-erythritol kinase n=1 Tax=Dyella sp. TaxID=1869338 RepID=UPI002ED6A8DF
MFSIQRANHSQIGALCAIERSAVELFRGHEAWPAYRAIELPPDLLADAMTLGLVWVALSDEGEPVGFICLDAEEGGDSIGIAEIDVLPTWGRRGIGAALLEHACGWAREAGYRSVLLGTLRDVPWNAPFYADHGFMEVDKRAPEFAFALQRDRENGFPDHLRVFMRRELAPLAAGDWTIWPAPAKLNLFLRITGRRDDGYHELQTVFRLLDWGDELRLRQREDGQVLRLHEIDGVPAETDLVVRAARLLQPHARAGAGVDIALEKRVPLGGGLGGGSSDAATMLVALNQLWACGLSVDALVELGLQLGADVPVFVRGRSAWAEGIGEKLRWLKLPQRWYVVVDPHEHVPTGELFQAAELTRNAPRVTISSFTSGETAENAFEPVVRARHPKVDAALNWLGEYGKARLSGSGACVFVETRSRDAAEVIAEACPASFTARVVAGVNVSPLHEALRRHGGRA